MHASQRRFSFSLARPSSESASLQIQPTTEPAPGEIPACLAVDMSEGDPSILYPFLGGLAVGLPCYIRVVEVIV